MNDGSVSALPGEDWEVGLFISFHVFLCPFSILFWAQPPHKLTLCEMKREQCEWHKILKYHVRVRNPVSYISNYLNYNSWNMEWVADLPVNLVRHCKWRPKRDIHPRFQTCQINYHWKTGYARDGLNHFSHVIHLMIYCIHIIYIYIYIYKHVYGVSCCCMTGDKHRWPLP